MPRDTLIKLTKTKHKERILKAARGKQQYTRETPMLNSWSFSRNSEGQKGIAGYISSTEREKSTTKITVPGKDLIQNWWRNKKISRQAKVKRIQYHQTSFTINVKGTYILKKYREEKDLQNQRQTIKKMAIGMYISIINLNVNGLNAPTKRQRLAEWIQKQDPYLSCVQETLFRPRHI